MNEPEIGEYVRETGAVICHIMRPGYIGQKVLYDCSTESQRNLYQCGILEEYIPYENRMRSIIYVGKRQRILLTHYPGREIYECLPWDEYPERAKRLKPKPAPKYEQLSLWE